VTPTPEGATEGGARERLQGVQHIVVLMMENRSFDQMLGFLSKHGRVPGVEGLKGGEVNYDEHGNPYESFEWGEDETSFHPPQDRSGKILDPCHGPGCVKEQLEPFRGETPGGFVKNFMRRKDANGNRIEIRPQYRGLPMGYYSEKHLPVYDLLARKYAVCDAWHSSIPGDTWPNRLYAMAGEEGPKVSQKRGFLHLIAEAAKRKLIPGLGAIANAPIYDVAAFTRQLRDEQWRWYSHDPATLRGADGTYREFHRNRENFA
jgi:phospholipase C